MKVVEVPGNLILLECKENIDGIYCPLKGSLWYGK